MNDKRHLSWPLNAHWLLLFLDAEMLPHSLADGIFSKAKIQLNENKKEGVVQSLEIRRCDEIIKERCIALLRRNSLCCLVLISECSRPANRRHRPVYQTKSRNVRLNNGQHRRWERQHFTLPSINKSYFNFIIKLPFKVSTQVCLLPTSRDWRRSAWRLRVTESLESHRQAFATPADSHVTRLTAFCKGFTCRSVAWHLGQKAPHRKCGHVSLKVK